MEEEKIIIGNEHIGIEEYLDDSLEFMTSGIPKFDPITIIDFDYETDNLFLEEKIYQEYGVYKYKKVLKFSSTNMKIVRILKDCYDNDVYITLGKNKMLVINKDNMWEYLRIIKDYSYINYKGKEVPDSRRRYYNVDVKVNKSSTEQWDYLNDLKRQIKKPKIWCGINELKKHIQNEEKWKKIHKHYTETGRYLLN